MASAAGMREWRKYHGRARVSIPSVARILSIDPANPEPAVLREAADLLRAGQLVAFPTETVYGLAGLALSRPSIEAIFRAKGRPETHPLIAHVLDQAAARELVATWPVQASLLAKRFWPGPLTCWFSNATLRCRRPSPGESPASPCACRPTR